MRGNEIVHFSQGWKCNAMDSAGLPIYDTLHTGTRGWSPHVEGTDRSEAVRNRNYGAVGLNGLYGDDVLWSGEQSEWLVSETGNSLLYGGGGNDTFIYRRGDSLWVAANI